MNDLVSIIIPVYKVESYLHRCVDSVLAQTYRNIEIILIDDGSPDNCPTICDQYAAKDNRVKVIHKPNGGLSDARNAGIDIASGSWISFIDSDDWVEADMYESLVKAANMANADISAGGVNDEISIGGVTKVLKTTFHGKEHIDILSNTDAMKRYFCTSWAAWGKIYRREVFDNISFPAGEINEDEAIVLYLLERCTKVLYTNKVFYHYVHRPDSITTSDFSEKKIAWYDHCKQNLDWTKKHHPELEIYATQRLCNCILWTLREIALSSGSYREIVSLLKKDIRDNYCIYKKSGLVRTQKLRLLSLKALPFWVYKTVEEILKVIHDRSQHE